MALFYPHYLFGYGIHNQTFPVRGSHISLFDTSSGSGMGSGSLAGVASSCDENWVPTEFDGDKTR
jgi:hypothetical protein